MKPLIYFICTGNSCRSQMAEGLARHILGDRFDVKSAGLEPSTVNPTAIQVMAEVGIDISHHTSKALDPSLLSRAEVVITLCGDARDRCPNVATGGLKLHWDLPDPARAEGTVAQRLDVFRSVRDDIRRRMESGSF